MMKEFDWKKFKNQMSVLFTDPYRIMTVLFITTYAIFKLNFVIIKESIYETAVTYFMEMILYLIMFIKLLVDFYKEEKFFLSLGYTRKNFYQNNVMFTFIYSICYGIMTIIWIIFIKEDAISFDVGKNPISNYILISLIIFIVNILLAYISCMQLAIIKTISKCNITWIMIVCILIFISRFDYLAFNNNHIYIRLEIITVIVLMMYLIYKKSLKHFFKRDV